MYTRADMVGVEDPGHHIFRQVKSAAYPVYEKMGGKEKSRVGVLIYNIYTSSWNRKSVHKDMEKLNNMAVVGGIQQLKARHEEWRAALLEVMYCDYASEELVQESAERVFQRFQPMLRNADREARKRAAEEGGTGIDVPKYLDCLKQQVIDL